MKLNLDSRGNKATLKARLNNVRKNGLPSKDTEKKEALALEYLLICDIEATCEDHRPDSSHSCSTESESSDYQHEIIELPVLLYSIAQKRVLSEFRQYVRPLEKPTLSEFCKSLTRIDQATIDDARDFTAAFHDLETWLVAETADLFVPPIDVSTERSTRFKGPRYRSRNWAFCTDGRADLEQFMATQLSLSKFNYYPQFLLGPYVDSRALFSYLVPGGRKLCDQLQYFNLRFEGTQHSGLDDSRNIARIVTAMLEKGWKIECNRFVEEVECGWLGSWSRKFREKREAREKQVIRVIDELD